MGIYVANVPDYGVEEVADSAMNHILNLMRHTVQASLQVNQVPDHLLFTSTALQRKGCTIAISDSSRSSCGYA